MHTHMKAAACSPTPLDRLESLLMSSSYEEYTRKRMSDNNHYGKLTVCNWLFSLNII